MSIFGGSGEIRTHGRFPVAGFQDRCNRPLCHASGSGSLTGLEHALFLDEGDHFRHTGLRFQVGHHIGFLPLGFGAHADGVGVGLVDDCLVMERGEVIARGPGSEMEAKGIRQLVAI